MLRPLLLLLAPALAAQVPCEQLVSLSLPHAQVTSATKQPAGSPKGAAARCVVQLVSRPTLDSQIGIEVWLPEAGWNGKYLQSGNGGWAGSIPTGSLVTMMERGYAVAATDDGHTNAPGAGPADWAIGHPEKLIDFGHRAVHETSVQAKLVIAAHYGKAPARSYFMGCSDGGREALMEAQRYPEDFEGIIAGAPANNWTKLMAGFVWNERALLDDPAGLITPAKLPAIQRAVLEQCDELDGVKDGLLEDPRRCRFNPAPLACQGAETDACLTALQLAALRKIHAGPRHPATGAPIFPGYPPGHEAIPGAWRPWIINTPPTASYQISFGNSFFGQALHEKKEWDFRTFDLAADLALAETKAAPVLNSTNPDLRSFRARGGKLLQYHGWADAAISPYSSIDYYDSVAGFFGRYPDARHAAEGIDGFYRLFLVPGMGHCGGGAGPHGFGNYGNQFKGDAERDILTALERWVEQGTAPARLVGTNGPLSRPLCAYPQVANYQGGDPNLAASFRCALPKP